MLLFLYNLLLLPALGLAFPIYLRRMLRRGGYGRNFVQRFGFYSKRLRMRFPGHRWIWIRAVSVGEMVTGLRLVEALSHQDPGLNFLLSTTTSTGYQLGLDQANAATTVVVYNPIDFWPVVTWVWRRIQPECIVLIDSDLWPSFLAIAHNQRTPVYLANARLSPRSEPRYRRTAWLAKRFFWQRITQVLAQDEGDVPRWQSIGVPPERITVTGSIKFDIAEVNSTAGKRFFYFFYFA
jgi:3-deoxy-D-manno-octulosonic-acid transferase